MNHPIHSKDADVGCAWLASSANNRSTADNVAFAEALGSLLWAQKAAPYVDMLARVK